MKTTEEKEREFVVRMERYEREHEQKIAKRLAKMRSINPEMFKADPKPRKKGRYPKGPRVHEWPLHHHHKPKWDAQNGRCHWCCTDLKVTGYQIDHVFPKVLGGSDDSDNLRFTCPTCNLSKNAKLPLDFALSLFR